MDFTTTNIVMCKEAKGIQEQWQPQRGDFAFWEASIEEPEPVLIYDVDGELLKVITLRHGTYHILTKDDLIWLPRQDQLLEMCHETCKWVPIPYLEWLHIIPKPEDNEAFAQFKTYEQLWLALLMWTKEGKVWDAQERRWR